MMTTEMAQTLPLKIIYIFTGQIVTPKINKIVTYKLQGNPVEGYMVMVYFLQ